MDGIGEDTDYDKPNMDDLIFHIMEANVRAANTDVAQDTCNYILYYPTFSNKSDWNMT